jgi:ribosome biogenesis GTPase / thiamine phosphate phosphatase
MSLETLGFCEALRCAFAAVPAYQHAVPARISAVHREQYRVLTAAGSGEARLAGRLRKQADPTAWPVTGDWVALHGGGAGELGTIVGVLPRRSLLVRKRPDQPAEPQPMAANVDVAIIVSSLDGDFEPRRIERALALIWEAGAEPVIALTKLDLCPDPSAQLALLAQVAHGCAVHAVSAHTGHGMSELEAHLRPGRTLALLGSSGVGKSTLVNRWLGAEHMATRAARSGDDKGRHTTTHRELFVLASGAMLIDTPGMRELGLWDASSGHKTAFAEVEQHAARCRFGDCTHEREPGCEVRAAVERGELDPARLASYRKLQRELAHTERAHDARARSEHQRALRSLQRQHTRAQRARSRD